MKYNILSLLIIATPLTGIGQEIPKKANIIIIKGVGFLEAANKLLDAGYPIEQKDNDLQTVVSEPQVLKKFATAYITISIRIKDSSAYIFAKSALYTYGKLNPNNLFTEWRVRNAGMKGSADRVTWDELNTFALSFNKPVEYKIQE